MAGEEGYSKFECKKCGRIEYLKPREDKAAIAKWHPHEWSNVDDVKTEELICEACETTYRAMRSEADAVHNGYISPKKEG